MTRSPIHATRLIAAALLLLASRGTSLAAQGLATPQPPIRTAPHKSPTTAFLLSLSATVVPLIIVSSADQPADGLTVFAIFAGPALGHFYAGKPGRAIAGMGIRAGLLALTALAAEDDCSSSGFSFCIPPAAVIGSLAVLTSMAVDIIAASASARHFNKEHASVAIVPLQNGAEKRLGVGIRMVF